MNIQVNAKHYTNASEVIAAARATRSKLLGPMKVVNWKPDPELGSDPEPVGPPTGFRALPPQDPTLMPFWIPLWMRSPIRYDAHVWAYHRHRGAGGHPVKEYVKRRCGELDVSYADLMVKTRRAKVVFVRQLIWWEIRNWVKPDFSLPCLGNLFGGFDHTSVLHGIRKIQAMKDAGEIE